MHINSRSGLICNKRTNGKGKVKIEIKIEIQSEYF